MPIESIHADTAPRAIGPYSQAVAVDGWVYCSGQIALDPATDEIVGEGDAGRPDGTRAREPRIGAGGGGCVPCHGREDHGVPRRHDGVRCRERGLRAAVRCAQAGACDGRGSEVAPLRQGRDRRGGSGWLSCREDERLRASRGSAGGGSRVSAQRASARGAGTRHARHPARLRSRHRRRDPAPRTHQPARCVRACRADTRVGARLDRFVRARGVLLHGRDRDRRDAGADLQATIDRRASTVAQGGAPDPGVARGRSVCRGRCRTARRR